MILQVLPGRCSSEVWLPCGARVGDGPDAHFVGVKFDVEGLRPRRDIEGDAVTNPLPKQVFIESRTCPSAPNNTAPVWVLAVKSSCGSPLTPTTMRPLPMG